MSAPRIELGPLPVALLNVDTGDMQERDTVVAQSLTLTQRTRVRNESGVDYACYLANIQLRGVVHAHMLWCMMAD